MNLVIAVISFYVSFHNRRLNKCSQDDIFAVELFQVQFFDEPKYHSNKPSIEHRISVAL